MNQALCAVARGERRDRPDIGGRGDGPGSVVVRKHTRASGYVVASEEAGRGVVVLVSFLADGQLVAGGEEMHPDDADRDEAEHHGEQGTPPGGSAVGLQHVRHDRSSTLSQSRKRTSLLPRRRHSCWARSRRALVMTLTEDSAMAAAAMMGESRRPVSGYSTPAAIGMPATL